MECQDTSQDYPHTHHYSKSMKAFARAVADLMTG